MIAGRKTAREKGRRAVCGWEANGGFLVGSDIHRDGRVLGALATRDAVLPLLCCLIQGVRKKAGLVEIFDALPKRYSKAGLLRPMPNAISRKVVARYTPTDRAIRDVEFAGGRVSAFGPDRSDIRVDTRKAGIGDYPGGFRMLLLSIGRMRAD